MQRALDSTAREIFLLRAGYDALEEISPCQSLIAWLGGWHGGDF